MDNGVTFQVMFFLISVSEIWLYYQLIFDILLEKRHFRKSDILLMGASAVGMSLLLTTLQTRVYLSHYVFLWAAAVMIVGTWIMIRRQFLLIVGIVFVYCSFIALMDCLFAFVQLAFLKNRYPELLYFSSQGTGLMLIAASVCSRIFMAMFVWLIRKSSIKNTLEEFWAVLLILGSVMLILVWQYQSALEHGMTFVNLLPKGAQNVTIENRLITLVMMLAIIVSLVVVLLKNKNIKRENDFLLLKEEMERRKYEELAQALEKNRELVHDTKNHYLIISEYERTAEYEKLHKYIEELKSDYVQVNPQIYTGNRILDLVLSQARIRAEQKGISFEMDVVPFAGLPFEDREVCSLFGNLLDNAVESCEKVTVNSKIRVKIQKQKQMIFIEIANTMNEIPIKREKGFFTSKLQKDMHGYGLKSVQRIVDAYEGVICFEVKEKEFIVTLTFFDIGKPGISNSI